MSSLAFSAGSCSPTQYTSPDARLLISNVGKTQVSVFSHQQKSSSQPKLQLNENRTSFRRREAIGFGLCFGLLDVLFQTQASAAAEEAPCELTVAPSGLAFCDKVVGFGPEAVKGQMIKVIKGWDQGILGGDGIPPMLAGGKRVLKIPPELAYGMRGAGCRGGSCIIPPDSVLTFNVEFIGKA